MSKLSDNVDLETLNLNRHKGCYKYQSTPQKGENTMQNVLAIALIVVFIVLVMAAI